MCAALRLIPDLQPLYFASYTTLLEALNNGNGKSPVMSLLKFYKQRIENFKTSAALGWNRSIIVAPELERAGCLTVEMLRNYLIYQMKQLGKFSFTIASYELNFLSLWIVFHFFIFRCGEGDACHATFEVIKFSE